MAKAKKYGYVEPDGYFPPEIRKMFEEKAEAESNKNDQSNAYRDQSKRLIDAQKKKKANKK